MPKVFGLHEIELQPGVEPEEYERFFADEIAPSPELPGIGNLSVRDLRRALAEGSKVAVVGFTSVAKLIDVSLRGARTSPKCRRTHSPRIWSTLRT